MKMILYTIGVFFIYLAWAFGGFFMHVFLDLATAKRTKKDFKLSTFWNRNMFVYAYSISAILISCALLAASPSELKQMPPVQVLLPIVDFPIGFPWQTWVVGIGYTGGAFLKKLLKKQETG